VTKKQDLAFLFSKSENERTENIKFVIGWFFVLFIRIYCIAKLTEQLVASNPINKFCFYKHQLSCQEYLFIVIAEELLSFLKYICLQW
jgi:hypothetical protein